MPKYIDAHCHLLDAPNIDLALSDARNVGVIGAVVAPATPSQWGAIVDLMHRWDFISGTVGVHPWNVCELPHNWSENLVEMLVQNPKLQVGEIGLDKNRPNLELQKNVFVRQLKIAHKYSRGIHLHCVGCWDVVLQILDENKNTLPPFILAHGFSGRAEGIKNIADKYNFYFSYSPRNLCGKLGAGRILQTPLLRLLVESDGADSAVLPTVVDAIAVILNMETNILSDIIYENTKRIL